MFCGVRHSVLLTESGKVWVTGGVRKEKAQVKKDLGEKEEEEKGEIEPELMPPEKSRKKGKKTNSKNTRTKTQID